jgi:hypothetical protein
MDTKTGLSETDRKLYRQKAGSCGGSVGITQYIFVNCCV